MYIVRAYYTVSSNKHKQQTLFLQCLEPAGSKCTTFSSPPMVRQAIIKQIKEYMYQKDNEIISTVLKYTDVFFYVMMHCRRQGTSIRAKYIQQKKKLRKSIHTTIQHKNTKANNYSIVIYLFRYMPSVEKNVYFSLLALIPLLWHSVK